MMLKEQVFAQALLLAGAVGDGLSDILEITPEDAARFAEQSKKIGPEALQRMLELFMRAEPDTRWASRPRTMSFISLLARISSLSKG